MWVKVVFIRVWRVLKTPKPMILQSQGQSEPKYNLYGAYSRQLARGKYAHSQP